MFCVRHTTMHQFTVRGHFMQSHRCTVHVHLAMTSHLHFWQSDQGLLCAAVVTLEEGGGGGWGVGGGGMDAEMSQHRKVTVENKILLPGLEPATFQSRIWPSTTELSPLPTWNSPASSSNSVIHWPFTRQKVPPTSDMENHILLYRSVSCWTTLSLVYPQVHAHCWWKFKATQQWWI